MPVRLPSTVRARREGPWGGPVLALILCLTAAAATFAVFAWHLPFALVLPLFSVVVIGGAAAIAFLAWTQPLQPSAVRITYWDVAGALTLIGITAALLSDPDQVVPLMEARRSD
jgi:hypothetical protein